MPVFVLDDPQLRLFMNGRMDKNSDARQADSTSPQHPRSLVHPDSDYPI
ncbi:hypothetical protein [Algoriphagus boritolerans]